MATQHNGSVTFGKLRGGRTAIVKDYGSISLKDDSATISTRDWVVSLPQSFYPIDYADALFPTVYKKQIGFEAWLIVPEPGHHVPNENVP